MVATSNIPALDPRLPAPVQLFQRTFRELRPDSPFPYAELYAPDVSFQDPLTRAEGLDALRAHFDRLNANLRLALFDFQPTLTDGSEAFLPWTMRLELRRGPRGPIVVSGVTQLRFDQRIRYQRDHFDVGELAYEHLPLLGALIRSIKRRL
jgi:hypothetical protein